MALVGEDAHVGFDAVQDGLVSDTGNVTYLRSSVLAVAERGVREYECCKSVERNREDLDHHGVFS